MLLYNTVGLSIHITMLLYATNADTYCLSPDADLVIPGNKFVSTVHCVFVRGEGGRALIKDTSTNGTLLNGSRLARNSEVRFPRVHSTSFNLTITVH